MDYALIVDNDDPLEASSDDRMPPLSRANSGPDRFSRAAYESSLADCCDCVLGRHSWLDSLRNFDLDLMLRFWGATHQKRQEDKGKSTEEAHRAYCTIKPWMMSVSSIRMVQTEVWPLAKVAPNW